MPGGVGTMDELFEVLTLLQTQKIKRTMPIVLFNKDFWKRAINFESLVDHGTVSKEDLELFEYHDDVDRAKDYIISNMDLSTTT